MICPSDASRPRISIIFFLDGVAGRSFTARIGRAHSDRARSASKKDCPVTSSASSLLVFSSTPSLYSSPMNILRNGGGDWEPMLLGIEPRNCKVCNQGLYRDKTMLRGGWPRCAVCDEFVHYSCLASGKISFLKQRPRICKTCRIAEEQAKQGAPSPSSQPAPVGS